jgi:hypothetical protein
MTDEAESVSAAVREQFAIIRDHPEREDEAVKALVKLDPELAQEKREAIHPNGFDMMWRMHVAKIGYNIYNADHSIDEAIARYPEKAEDLFVDYVTGLLRVGREIREIVGRGFPFHRAFSREVRDGQHRSRALKEMLTFEQVDDTKKGLVNLYKQVITEEHPAYAAMKGRWDAIWDELLLEDATSH